MNTSVVRAWVFSLILTGPVLGVLNFSSQNAVASSSDATSEFQPGSSSYQVTERGPNQQVWKQLTYDVTAFNQTVTNISSYTELGSGLNYWDSSSNQWLASKEEILPLVTGGAAATHGQHKVYFPYDIGQGAIVVVTPTGQEMDSRPVSISYCDGTNLAVIANLTNSAGMILPSGNQVIYTNAFAGLGADLLCTYRKGSFESDVMLHEVPPSPAEYGINPATARLQIWTEFFSTNDPGASYDSGADTNLNDPYLDFGGMQMIHGRAFTISDTNAPVFINDPSGIAVKKTWVEVNNRRFLLEEVPYSLVQPVPANSSAQTNSLAAATVSYQKTQALSKIGWLPPRRTIASQTNMMQIAKRAPAHHQELVLDYLMISGYYTNGYTFRADTTYLISSPVYLEGSNVFEGGTVIKITNNYSSYVITLESGSTATWQTSTYHPIVFTSMNDNSIGQTIAGSTGVPVTSGGATYLFNESGSGIQIINARFKYAAIGIESTTWMAMWDSQFLNCLQALHPVAYFDSQGTYTNGFYIPYWGVALFNDLFANCGMVMDLDDGYSIDNFSRQFPQNGVDLYFTAQNVTINQSSNFLSMAPAYGGCCCCCGGCGCGGNGYYPTKISDFSQALLTNCLFTSVSPTVETYLLNTIGSGSGVRGYNNSIIYPYASPNYGCAFGGGNVVQLTNGAASPYQPTVAGDFYLATTNNYTSIGSSSVQSNLLTDLQAKTTEAPTVYLTNTWSLGNYVLQPVVLRDTNLLAIGYHYEPIDYMISSLYLTNSSVLITNGAVIGFGDGAGIIPQGGSQLISQGAPNDRDYFVHYALVQEQPTNWGPYNVNSAQAISPYHPDANTPPTIALRLSTIVSPNGATNVIYQPGGSYSAGSWRLQDCEIFGAGGGLIISPPTGDTVTLDNNLFKYCNAQVEGAGQAVTWNNLFTSAYSNSVYDAYFVNTGSDLWTNTDNAFDNVTVDLTGIYSNNAYLNQTVVNSTKQPSDITANLAWQAGPFGNYYQATNSPLIYKGSRTAGLAGLYHYTVTTNTVTGLEVPDGTNIVSIGYHYVATGTNGLPLDSNGDGIPDYLEDPTGAGILGPQIILVNPINGSDYIEPANIPLQSTVSDWSSIITNVEFYTSATGITGITKAPYNYTWPVVAAGAYSVSAIASDLSGLSATSSVVNVTVTNLCGD
jgi:hypothetical protein